MCVCARHLPGRCWAGPPGSAAQPTHAPFDALAPSLGHLQATHLDESLLAELAEEYASSRGLDVPTRDVSAREAAGERPRAAEPAPGADATAAADGSGEAMHVDAEPARAAQQAQQEVAQQWLPSKAGKQEGVHGCEALAAAAPGEGEPGAGCREQQVLQLPAELSEQQLRRLSRRLESLLAAGNAEQAIQQLEAADPTFLPDNPAAAFALHRCCFLQRLAAPAAAGGGTPAALAVLRQHLSPLAQQHPAMLQPQLKGALAQLLPLPAGAEDPAAVAAQQQRQQQQAVTDAVAVSHAVSRAGELLVMCARSGSGKAVPG